MKTDEKIEYSAVKIEGEDAIMIGSSHADIILKYIKYCKETNKLFNDVYITEGFLTTKGRFLNREDAADIAFNAGQISYKASRLNSFMLNI